MSNPTLGQMADTFYNARAERLALSKKLDELKALEAKAEQILMAELHKQGLEGCKGHVATAAIKRNVVADVTDRAALEGFIRETGDLTLLQFRPSITGLRARWENGETVPGVEQQTELSISLTKVGG